MYFKKASHRQEEKKDYVAARLIFSSSLRVTFSPDFG